MYDGMTSRLIADAWAKNTASVALIKDLLDKHCILVGNPDVVVRVKFALNLLNEKSDALANIRLGLERNEP